MTRSYPIAKSTTISSQYGQRGGDFHHGLDFACPVGTPIFAVEDGIVIEGRERPKGSVSGFGSWIWIDSQAKAGVDFIYGHVSHGGIMVKAGDRVVAGQQIGVSGNEGQSTGPHLHFEVWGPPGRLGGKSRNPAEFLAGASAPTIKEEVPVSAAKPKFNYHEKLCSSRSSRNGARVVFGLGHTQEGNGTALSLAAYLANPNNGASYHYTIDNNTLVAVVDTNYGSWSVLDANPRAINWCYAGSRAAWTRQQWIDNMRNGIRISAWAIAQDLKKYPYINGKVVQGRPYRKGNVPCISDHNFVSQVLRIGNHTDLGPNYPWDLFEADLKLYMGTAAPAPAPVNKINECAALPYNKYLGKRLDLAERPCKDGIGRFVNFEGGSIYWHPGVGAFAVPSVLFRHWGEMKWEQGPLGYPAGKYDEIAGGHVQHFEDGTLYLQNGAAEAFYVTGVIGARWKHEGFEKGPLGFPTSNEYPLDGGRAQNFEHGILSWHPSGATRALTTRDVRLELVA